MSSLRLPCRFQHENQLDSVRRLLGWTTLELVGRIRAGSIPLNNMETGEFILFNSYAMCGVVLPISCFFLLLLEEFGLQLQHLTPPLHPPRGRLRPLYGDVRGGLPLHRHLQAFLCPGRVGKEQARGRRLLLPAPASDGQLLHQCLLQRQVGGLARRLGHRQGRHQRPPGPADGEVPQRSEHLEGHAIATGGTGPSAGPDQGAGKGRPDVDDGVGRFLEASHHPRAAADQNGLCVHKAQ
jgi:hypothetical protein